MIEIFFSKMHGLFNSFIIIKDLANFLSQNFNLTSISQEICSKPKGIGADGLVLLKLPNTSSNQNKNHYDLEMKIYNSDGSEAMMCGNAIRCLAKYAYDEDILKKKKINFLTQGGLIQTTLVKNHENKGRIKVNLGTPKLGDINGLNLGEADLEGKILSKEKSELVSIGNKHLVFFVNDFDFDYQKAAHRIQKKHPTLNLEFVKHIKDNQLDMRVVEAGVGETLACGTGASAAAIASIQKNIIKSRKVIVKLRGGELEIVWPPNNQVLMSGDALLVAQGTYFLAEEKHLKK